MSAKKLLLNAVLLLGLVLAAYLLYRVFSRYSLAEIRASVERLSESRLSAGLAFAAMSYLCLTVFDWMGLRYAGRPLSYPKAALASFTGLSIGHNLGFAALSSGAVRYRYYSRWGLSGEEVARVIVFCGATVGIGLASLCGIVFVSNSQAAAALIGLPAAGVVALGVGCLVAIGCYLLMTLMIRAPLAVWRWRFKMPSFPLAVGQIVVGTLNFMAVAACLQQLLGADADFMETATAFVLANVAVLLTHVPGGLGVLEATVTALIPSASIGALVAFRVIYFVIPLLFGLVSFALSEIFLRRRQRSAADQTSHERREAQPQSP
ncbi:hypothetical protein ASE04_10655 [Rhizobium sp. Root708]|uniref:lysylphosphatidylglycerol synthase domain-containing protein n=1 Tax=Rhizobium sp. Root708 TaxID=1736592 RepID=UPI0006F83F49|nr:lysylphosphatidylglycerol synthase domain-containing protein [Rhizobium sp. Root708]KRB51509.1 hypothetical protein ASE04_10655 [Rhizobium sp. Root708]